MERRARGGMPWRLRRGIRDRLCEQDINRPTIEGTALGTPAAATTPMIAVMQLAGSSGDGPAASAHHRGPTEAHGPRTERGGIK